MPNILLLLGYLLATLVGPTMCLCAERSQLDRHEARIQPTTSTSCACCMNEESSSKPQDHETSTPVKPKNSSCPCQEMTALDVVPAEIGLGTFLALIDVPVAANPMWLVDFSTLPGVLLATGHPPAPQNIIILCHRLRC